MTCATWTAIRTATRAVARWRYAAALALAVAAWHPRAAAAQATAPTAQATAADSAALLAARLAARADSAARRQTAPDLERAFALWAESAALYARAGQPARVGFVLSRMGIAHRGAGRPDSALVYHRRALAARRSAGDLPGVSATLNNIGLVHADVGRLDSALASYVQAVRTGRAARDAVGQAYALGNLGAAYRALGRSDSALVHYRAALAFWRQLGNRTGEAGMLVNVGDLAARAERPDSALVYYTLALPIWRETGNRAGEGLTLNNVGTVHQRAGRADSALAYYRLALPIWQAAANARNEAATLHNVGEALADLRRPDSARIYFERALGIRRTVDDRAGTAGTLASIAALLAAWQPGDPTRRATAAAYFDTAAAAYAELRRNASGDANAIGAAEEQQETFAGWALAWLARAPDLGEAASAGGALAAVERGRGQALLAIWRRDTVGAVARPGADLAAEAEALLRPLRRRGTAVLTYLVTRDTLVTWLLSTSGDLRVHRAAVARDTVARVVRALHAALETSRSGTAALARAQAVLAAADAPADGPVDDAPAPGSRARGARGGLTDAVAARRLAALLLPAPLRPHLPSAGDLVIVPHGALTAVPFALLPADSTGQPLGIRNALRYAPSLAALNATDARAAASPAQAARGEALVVGDPAMPSLPGAGTRGGRATVRALPALPGAAREARWVASRLGTRPLIGRAATESTVVARLPAASIVHLATHGFAFGAEARARDSFVALAPDAGSDGLLTAGELLDDPALELRADLVVLSACQTGLGTLTQAEGVIGLQRAFLARGARSVLASLWSVSDVATELLMRRMYTHWSGDADGPSKGEALRRAQEDVRRDARFAHPRYWAAFQLVGGG